MNLSIRFHDLAHMAFEERVAHIKKTDFFVRGIIEQSWVKVIATTDDSTD